MASSRSAWGIDLGNRALKALKLGRDGGKLVIEDFEIIEHEQILSNAGDNKESLIQTALANFAQRHDVRKVPVAVSVSGQASFARFIKLPPVEPKKIPEIVRFEAIQQIPFPLDDVEWSYQLFQEKDSPEVEVGIFAMRRDLVNKHVGYFTGLDLNVLLVQMSPLAVYNAMYHDNRIHGTTMFMDMGAEHTDLIIAEGETVWLRSLPIGGNNFTETLAKGFRLSFAKAEELKRNAATSKYARQIFQAMRPVFADLVAEVQRSIGFYASVHRDARIKRVIALGGTFRLPGLQKYLQQNLQLDVHRIDALAAGVPSDPKLATSFTENVISLATAYGLALQALGEGKIVSSLLPAHIRRAKMWQDKTKWFAAAAAVFLLGAVGFFGSWYSKKFAHDRSYQIHTANQQTFSKAKRLSEDWAEVERRGEDDRQRIINAHSSIQHRDVWPAILRTIESSLPDPGARTWEQLKATPRGQRNLIVLDSVRSVYYPDMSAILDDPNGLKAHAAGGGMGPAAPLGGLPMPGRRGREGMDDGASDDDPRSLRQRAAPAPTGEGGGGVAASGGPRRGFLVTLRGTTPNSGGARFIDSTLVKQLKTFDAASARKGQAAFYIHDAEISTANARTAHPPAGSGAFEAEDADLGGVGAGTGAGAGAIWGGAGRRWDGDGEVGGGLAAGGPPKEGPDPEADPFIPSEKITGDIQFTVLVAVVLDPPPPAPSATDQEPAASR